MTDQIIPTIIVLMVASPVFGFLALAASDTIDEWRR